MTPPSLCAILVDVENLLGFLKVEGALRLVELASEFGSPTIRRAYGTWANPSVQERVRDLTLAGFELIHGYHPVAGKDSADVQMVVDAMDLLARVDGLQTFVLATGDSDFSPLFRKLRERGRDVVGVGPHSPLAEFAKSSCTRYVYVHQGPAGARTAAAPGVSHATSPTHGHGSGRLEDALEVAARVLRERGGVIDHAGLKSQLQLRDPAFDERALGFRTFRDFASRIPDTQTRLDGTVYWTELRDVAAAPESVSTEGYRTVLRGRGWRPAEPEHVLAVWRHLGDYAPMTKAALAATLAGEAEDGASTSAFHRAFDTLFRAGVAHWAGTDERGASVWAIGSGFDADEVLRLHDVALLRRLSDGLAERGLELVPETVWPLLASAPGAAGWPALLAAALDRGDAVTPDGADV